MRRFDELECLLRGGRGQVQARELGARARVVGADIDHGLVELRRFARVAELLIDEAHVESRLHVLGRDLQDILKFDARLVEIPRGQERFALLQVPRPASLGAAATGGRQHRQPQKGRGKRSQQRARQHGYFSSSRKRERELTNFT